MSFAIAVLTVLMGQLDLIAGVVSMFFLISYGLLNYATYYEAAAESPSFRPRFRWYDKRISLAGSLICLGVMLAIDFKTGTAAAAILYAIFQYLKRTSAPARWADSRRSYQLKLVRDNLIAAGQDPEHPRDWRPYVLALSNGTDQMMELLDFASLIEGKSGMTTAVRMIKARGYRSVKLKDEAQKALSKIISESGNRAFPLVLSSEYSANGLSVLLQSFGIGPVKANTVLLNWNDKNSETDPLQFHDYKKFIRLAIQTGCNTILLDHKANPEIQGEEKAEKTIDVWWCGDDTSRLMLLLAYLTTRHEKWENARIRLLATHLDRDNDENIKMLTQILDEIRIPAEPRIVLGADHNDLIKISGEADLVFTPVILKHDEPVIFENVPVQNVLPDLNTVAMVMAAQKIDLDTEPEEGEAGELAVLFDELKHAEKRVQAAEKNAYQTMRSATDFIEKTQEEPLNDPNLMAHLKEAVSLREKSEEANKKLLKERAKLMEISQRAKDKGISVEKDPE